MVPANGRMFFVESYVPQLDAATAAVLTSRLQSAVEQLKGEGLALSWIRSFVLLDEDTYAWMIEAAEVDHVHLVQSRAGLERDHIAEVAPSPPRPT